MLQVWIYKTLDSNLSFKRLSTEKTRVTSVLANDSPQNTSATYIFARINSLPVKATIDSGAAATLMRKEMAQKLKLKIHKSTERMVWIAANGEKLNEIGYCFIELKIGNVEITHKCTIIENLSTNLLLGTDLLVSHGFIIDYKEKKLKLGECKINIHTERKQEFSYISASKRIVIKPFSTHMEWIPVPKDLGEEVIVEGIEKMSLFRLKNGLFSTKNERISLVISNENRFPIAIGKGTHMAKIERAMKVQSVEKKTSKNHKVSEQLNFDKNDLSSAERTRLKQLMDKYNHVFSSGEHDLGFYNKEKFEIDTKDETPIKNRAYRVPYAKQETIDMLIDDMLLNKKISKSRSPWASPIVLVKKKDGSDRFCVDYRKLNAITVKDNYPVPLIEETLDSLEGSNYFTSFDLASGYWQMALSDEAKKKTAFICKKGLYQFEVLPFGLSNAVAFFQRTMESILEGLPNTTVYLDDIMIYSKTLEDHLKHIEAVLKRLEEANLKIKPSKCAIAENCTKFLGFDINKDGIKPCKDKIKPLKNYPVPKNPRAVKRFLGLASYYRKFIPHYSTITEPINRLLKKDVPFDWLEIHDKCFHHILDRLTNPPILIYPDLKKRFILATDASLVGLGAVLSQLDNNGRERVVSYASRMLLPSEKNYSTTELEALGVIWAIEHFKPYLWGREFDIATDHNPLVYIENMKDKSSRVTKWRLRLSEYRYKIEYKKGSANTNADALSRIEIDDATTKLVSEGKSILSQPKEEVQSVISTPLNLENLQKLQEEDKEIKSLTEKTKATGGYLDFVISKGLLKKKVKVKGSIRYCVVIPETLKETVLQLCHNDMSGGHLGMKKTWPKVRNRFFWKNAYNDTKEWLDSCKDCASRKNPQTSRPPLLPILEFSKPFDMMGVDILGPLTETMNGNMYVVVFTDYLTRWVEAFPMKDMQAKTIAKIFVNEIICRHSAPKVLLSDQGKQFMSELVKSLCEYMRTKKINTTAYHPQTNGLTERFNATLCQILSMYTDQKQTDWDEFIPTALFAYRVSLQETTQLSPFETLYNYEARLPSDLENATENIFTKDIKSKWKLAKTNIEKGSRKNKKLYDSKYREKKIIEIGDKVRLHSPATRVGLKEKLRGDMWHGPYQVMGKLENGNLKLNVNKNIGTWSILVE